MIGSGTAPGRRIEGVPPPRPKERMALIGRRNGNGRWVGAERMIGVGTQPCLLLLSPLLRFLLLISLLLLFLLLLFLLRLSPLLVVLGGGRAGGASRGDS